MRPLKSNYDDRDQAGRLGSKSSKSPPRLWPHKRAYYGWAVVGAAFLASFGEVPAFGPILGLFIKPIESELGWSRSAIALGFTIGSASGAIASLAVGRIVDRYGPRWVVGIGGILIVLSLSGLSQIQEPWHFWTLFGIARGSAIAGIDLGASVAIAKWFVRRRGRALGIKGMGLRSGQAALPIFVFSIMSISDWRTAYLALAMLAAVTIVLPSLVYMRRRPEDFGMNPDGDSPTNGTDSDSKDQIETSWTLSEARRTKAFWAITFYLICTPFVQGATNLHMVPHFQDRGLSDGLAFTTATLVGVMSTISIIPASFILDRVHVRKGAMIMAVFVGCSMVLLIIATSFWQAVLFSLVYGVAGGMRMIIETKLVADYFGRDHLGAIKGFMAPLRVVSPIGPLMAGLVFDTTGSYTLVLVGFGCISLFMISMMIVAIPPTRVPETLRNDL